MAKTGDGRLRMESMTCNPGAVFAVEDGSLALSCNSFGATANVADGATLEMLPSLLSGSTVNVASGGTLAVADVGDNLVENGDFEADAISGYSAMNPSGWTRSLTDDTGTYNNLNGDGVQKAGSALSENGPSSAEEWGPRTAYMRNYTKLEQAITIPETGLYRVSFAQSVRKDTYDGQYISHRMRTSMKIGGDEVLAVGPFDEANYDYTRFSAVVALEAGDTVLSFDTTGTEVKRNGAMLFIDDVRVERFGAADDISNGSVNLASGAVLSLSNENRMRVRNFFVDGNAVTGGKSAIEAAGVTVVGSGRIVVGAPAGMTIIAY